MMQRTLSSLIVLSIFTNIFAGFVPAQSTEKSDEPEKGLIFSLRELPSQPKPTGVTPTVSALDEASVQEIYDRLPPIPVDASDVKEFSIRPESLPPPKAGRTIPVDFAPQRTEDLPQTSPSGKLEVLRYSPRGLTMVATDLSVTFSEPMVAVGAQSDASKTVPVKLEPEAKGRWRWLGTKTIIFDADKRFPMSSTFTVTIPAGIRSLNGAVLDKDVSWTFTTPTVSLANFRPVGSQIRPNALMAAIFDQRIEAEKILEKTVAAINGKPLALRQATPDEIKKDEEISKFIKDVPADRVVVFRAVEPLPPDSQVKVVFGTGLPSAEGPMTTTADVLRVFKTYGSFRFERTSCGWQETGSTNCIFYEDFRFDFTNRIDPEKFDKSLVSIEPPIEDADIVIYNDQIDIERGERKPGQKYRVTISGKLTDVFGQELGRDVSAEFKIVPDEPQIWAEKENEGFATIDPAGKPYYSVLSEGFKRLRVKVYAVTPEDFAAYVDFLASKAERSAPTIGKLVVEKKLKVGGKRGEARELKIGLAPAMPGGTGHAIVVVEPEADSTTAHKQRIVMWLQSTKIGVDAVSDQGKLVAYVSDLMTGKPLDDVGLTLAGGATTASDITGLARLDLPELNATGDWLIARRGTDSAILLAGYGYRTNMTWMRKRSDDQLKWFVFDDRALYRPGETVAVKGYIRRFTGGAAPDIDELRGTVSSANWVLRDPLGNELSRGTVMVKEFGAFDMTIKLPDNVNLGRQKLEFKTASQLDGADFDHYFRVEEFRRPDFEVKAKPDSAAPYQIGGSAVVAVNANYYSGGPLAGAESTWTVKSTPTTYTPPNRDDFTFGEFEPWWTYRSRSSRNSVTRTIKGKTDAAGRQRIAIDFAGADEARPYSIEAEAKVTDVNRQTFASTATLLVHPSDYYVGLRTARTFVQPNQSFELESIVTDIDGKAVSGVPVTIVAELKDYEQVKGKWVMVPVSTESCEVRSAETVSKCGFNATRGGTYEFTASVRDEKGRKNVTKTTVWVGGESREPVTTVTSEDIELIPGKREYVAGENAEVLLNAPFYPAEGVLTVRRRGIVRTERISVDGPSMVLKVPVEESFVPGFSVKVDLYGSQKRVFFEDERDKKLPDRPAYASGELTIDVAKTTRQLTVSAEARKRDLAPGGETEIEIAVKDDKGRPASGTEVAVVAADESVLALTDYHVGDPTDSFYTGVYPRVSSEYSRGSVILANPWDFLPKSEQELLIGAGRGAGYGNGDGNGVGDGSGGGVSFGLYDVGGMIPRRDADSPFRRLELITSLQRPPNVKEIRMRQNFSALALFSPSVRTDADGRATVKLKLPDNLTRYRITAVAATESNKFGKSESTVTASQPLMIRPSAPRFLNLGDRAEVPVVVQNTTGETRSVNVAIRSTNARFTDGIGRRVNVPANDRVELRFPVSTASAGFARFQVGGVSGELADAAEFALPVLTPVTSEAFATYGTTDQNGAFAIPIAAPKDVITEYGGVEVTTSSTQMQELTDALIYLQTYPFECTEQRSSRMLSTAALRDVLEAFKSEKLPPKEDLEDRMADDISKLVKLQHKDGGWSYWRTDDSSVPYVSVHVTHALFRAKEKGFAVPQSTLSRASEFLEKIEDRGRLEGKKRVSASIAAYAIFVRDLMGSRDVKKARRLVDDYRADGIPLEALGWLLPTLAKDPESAPKVAEIERVLMNSVSETANAATFATSYSDDDRYVTLASNRRTDGIILDALLRTRPAAFEDLIPKIVRGLLDGRVRGRWYNTQENAFAMLALDRYLEVFEKEVPDFRARIWFGNDFVGEQTFRGRTAASNVMKIPIANIQQKPETRLTFDLQGTGRFYYRVGMTYAPKDSRQEAADYGFEVSRGYEAIDDPGDVTRATDGTIVVKSGARIRIRLNMVAPATRFHVALVDNLPAGFEIINPDLLVSERLPTDPLEPRWRWWDHLNLRDNRAELFASYLQSGVRTYSYVVRATTPGDFIVPPAKAEEMYSPETFGRSATERVEVK